MIRTLTQASFREGWLEHEFMAVKIEQEEYARARKRMRRRMSEYDKRHPLGKPIPTATYDED